MVTPNQKRLALVDEFGGVAMSSISGDWPVSQHTTPEAS